MQPEESDLYIVYDCLKRTFQCSDKVKEWIRTDVEAGDFIENLIDEEFITCSNAGRINRVLNEITSQDKPVARHLRLAGSSRDGRQSYYRVGLAGIHPRQEILITISKWEDTAGESAFTDEDSDRTDALTGLYNRSAFITELCRELRTLTDPSAESLMMVYFDVQRFKVINDMFGMTEGDRLLIHIAAKIKEFVGKQGAGCRLGSDRFLFFYKAGAKYSCKVLKEFLNSLVPYDMPFDIICNAGAYVVTDPKMGTNAIIDRAIIAQSAIKGSYAERFRFYTEEMRAHLISESEITGSMRNALLEEQFVIYYQPQYNHSSGMLVGAEALARWKHPEKGLISPAGFIPVFEKNGFITDLDLYMFEHVCRFLKQCMEQNYTLVPVSVNITRQDLFYPCFFRRLEEIRSQYGIPARHIRIEITESAAIGNSRLINEALDQLHSYGYLVEMDDFGSGYSSLNILKDIHFDLVKLDMLFLQNKDQETNRGGIILSSVVRMLNWLGMPMIAEGVETVGQADYLRSIGCDYIQGYLYSKPLPEEEYCQLVSRSTVGSTLPHMKMIEHLDACNFWSDSSLETLVFNHYVGGAGIFEYKNGKLEMLRVNPKYVKEIGMNLPEKEIIHTNPLAGVSEAEQKTYLHMLKLAIKTGEEQECETWRRISSPCCGEDTICIRSNVRVIGESSDSYLFYGTIRNITAEKMHLESISESEKKFRMASEQAQIYCWEYNIATREMRPCFRCMRDLGLPAVLRNYPDSAFELGIFPPEVSDLYRDWHRQLAEGVPKLEAVLPMTMERILFRVRYTTEFDENGHPVKAYGSAELIGDKNP